MLDLLYLQDGFVFLSRVWIILDFFLIPSFIAFTLVDLGQVAEEAEMIVRYCFLVSWAPAVCLPNHVGRVSERG